MIKNFSDFKNKSIIDRLKYMALDFDDNILHMPTVIHMDNLNEDKWIPLSVSPSEFAIVRNDSNYRVRDNNPSKAYEEFRDIGPRGQNAFLEDIKIAIDNKNYGPSWDKFLKGLREGYIFSLITARGHEYDTLKEGIKYIIDNCLTLSEQNEMYNKCLKYSKIFEKNTIYVKSNGKFTDNDLIKKYLECCKYYGVGIPFSQSFKKDFNLSEDIKIEEAKKIALNKFIEICNTYGEKSNIEVSIGFSDDDKKNVDCIKKYFEFKSTIYKQIKLNVYDTSDKQNSIKTKFRNGLVIENVIGPNMDGKDSSLLKFNNFNSMPNTLQFTTNDFSGYNQLQKVKVLNMLKKNTIKKKKYIKKRKPKTT